MSAKVSNPIFPATLALALLLAGCAAKVSGNSTTTASGTSSSNSSTTGTGALSVSSFSPASGSTLSSLPTFVYVTFSESNLDTTGDATSVTNVSNYLLQCGDSMAYATGVSWSGNTATITLPSESFTADAACTLTVSSSIVDTSGNVLNGSNLATYVVTTASTTGSSSSFAVSSFNPASETVSSLPTSVAVTFNETTLNTGGSTYSETNPANYALSCNGTTYSVAAASLTSSGVVTLTLPSQSLASGTVCTITASSSLEDANGSVITASSYVTYTIAAGGYSSTWNESSSPSYTATAGDDWVGQEFLDTVGSNTGIALTGINIRTGYYLDQITGVWTSAFSSSSSDYYGTAHGGAGGSSDGNIMCPSGMQMIGLYGTYSTQIDSIGIVCSTVNNSSTYQSATYGQAGSTSFQITCPSGQFATNLAGSAGNYVQTLSLGCQ